jgi:hypothetical protein
VNAELARLVGCSAHYATVPETTDDDSLAAQLGMVTLLDRRIESVHVNVQDGHRVGRHGRTFVR